jgi:MFS family permease
VFPDIAGRIGPEGPKGRFLLSVNVVPGAWTDPHGASVDWIGAGDSKSPQGYSKRRFSARPPRGFFGINGFASLVASTFIGMFVGTLLFNSLSDLFGRRACGSSREPLPERS